MQVNSSTVAGARPPVVGEFFLGRVFEWIFLVGGCALPLAVMTWRQFTPLERAGEALGVAAWVVVMVSVTSREADRRSKMLRTGALVTALVHAGLAVFAGALGLFLWFAPAVLVGSNLPLISELESGFWNAFIWTMVCGAQSAVVAWLSGAAVGRAVS